MPGQGASYGTSAAVDCVREQGRKGETNPTATFFEKEGSRSAEGDNDRCPWHPGSRRDRGHPPQPSPRSRGCSAFSYPMSPARWRPLDLNGESPGQRTTSPQSALKASRSTRRTVRFRRGALLLLDPLQPDQLVTVENATQTAGSALGVDPVTRRAGRHYAWLRVGRPSPDI